MQMTINNELQENLELSSTESLELELNNLRKDEAGYEAMGLPCEVTIEIINAIVEILEERSE